MCIPRSVANDLDYDHDDDEPFSYTSILASARDLFDYTLNRIFIIIIRIINRLIVAELLITIVLAVFP